jgi:hypothetical protein
MLAAYRHPCHHAYSLILQDDLTINPSTASSSLRHYHLFVLKVPSLSLGTTHVAHMWNGSPNPHAGLTRYSESPAGGIQHFSV